MNSAQQRKLNRARDERAKQRHDIALSVRYAINVTRTLFKLKKYDYTWEFMIISFNFVTKNKRFLKRKLRKHFDF